jgi:5-methylcytosine-specific restriction endonuclease McrA
VHVREVDAEWAKNNPDAVREKYERYRLRHPERVRKANQKNHAQYYANNREAVIQKTTAYRKANPQVASATQRKRRAEKKGSLINDFTHKQWLEMQIAYNHRCAYCGKRCKGRLTQEHITPISKGGSHTLSNIVPACQSCNSKKATGPPLCPVQPLLITIEPPSNRYHAEI